jgi:hypothetical protein
MLSWLDVAFYTDISMWKHFTVLQADNVEIHRGGKQKSYIEEGPTLRLQKQKD